jgi:hypothetical protein
MPSIALKRINKEIENYNAKAYLATSESAGFSKHLLNYLAGLVLELSIMSISNKDKDKDKDEYFLLIKDANATQLLQLAYPEYYPFKPYSVLSYRSSIISAKNEMAKNEMSYYKYLIAVNNAIKTKDKNIYKFFYKNLYGHEPLFLNLASNDCYCCNSNTCRNIWSPSLTINSIILEQLEIRFIETYCTKVGYSYLSNIYNNLMHTVLGRLPEEIISAILK